MRVIVVGAGPTGAALSWLLARRGIEVVLVEREATLDRVFRGEALMPSGVDALEQMGLEAGLAGIPQRTCEVMEFYVDGLRMFRFAGPEVSGPNAMRIVSQADLLERLIAEAGHFPGFTFERDLRVRDFSRLESGALEVRAQRGSEALLLEADYLIGADGRASMVRKRAGLSLDSLAPGWGVVWYSVPLPADLEERPRFMAFSTREQQVVLYPSWDGRMRLGWLVREGSYREIRGLGHEASLDEIAGLLPPDLAAHLQASRADVSEPVFLKVVFGRCPSWSAPGVLLLGDAAHPMSPARAQGINMGLRDAIVAANHLVPVLCDGAPPESLDAAAREIQREREPEIERAQALQLAVAEPPAIARRRWFRRWVFPLLDRTRLLERFQLRAERVLRRGVVPVELSV